MSESVHDLNTDLLLPYLEQHVAGFCTPAEIEKFAGGQSNPTYKILASTGEYVLRRQPPGKLLKSAHAVDREFRVLEALADTGVPVARALHLCEDVEVIGSMFYVMEFCDGRIFWDAALPELDRDSRSAVYDELVRTLVTLHSVDTDAVGLSDFGKPGNYFERQYSRWSGQYRAAETSRIDAMERVIEWLASSLPADDGRVALVHGDYRLDNIIFEHDSPRARAVLDWELSTLGHPFADVGYLCMQLRMPQGIGNMSGLMGRDLAALGIPNEDEILARYCKLSGIEKIENFSFYVAFSFFRLASIVQGVAKRALDGNASNQRAAEVGKFVEPLAGFALTAIEKGEC